MENKKRGTYKKLNIVIPVFNDAECIPPLIGKIDTAFINSRFSISILLVDNGSATPLIESREIIEVCGSHDIRIVRADQNIGYGGAIRLGLEYSFGDFVAVIDADHEDPPLTLRAMADKLVDSDMDYIYGIREKRQVGILWGLSYKIFYILYNIISDYSGPKDAGEFAIYKRALVERINRFPKTKTFVRGLRTIASKKCLGYKYHREPRYGGVSKFKVNHSYRLAMDGIFLQTQLPVRILNITGIVLFLLLGFVLLINVILAIANGFFHTQWKMVLPEGLTQTSVMIYLGLLLLFAYNMVIGEYVLSIYKDISGLSEYYVDEERSYRIRDHH